MHYYSSFVYKLNQMNCLPTDITKWKCLRFPSVKFIRQNFIVNNKSNVIESLSLHLNFKLIFWMHKQLGNWSILTDSIHFGIWHWNGWAFCLISHFRNELCFPFHSIPELKLFKWNGWKTREREKEKWNSEHCNESKVKLRWVSIRLI